MAKIIKKNNEPQTPETKTNSIPIIILVIIVLISGAVFYIEKINEALIPCLAAIALLFGIFLSKAAVSYTPESKSYGNLGEEVAGVMLEKFLPDSYTVIQNAVISYGSGQSEIDNIVIGRSGVFIIEVKNSKGTIIGDCENKDWLQQKTDRYGIEHQKYFYNPIKQVGTHIYRLANYLRDNKIFTHIKGAVYFANSNTSLSIHGDTDNIPVFSFYSQNEMIDYIKEGTANLSDKTIERIIQLLN